MTKEADRPAQPSIREVKREIAEASDPQILRIVAAVEARANRGQADELISPFRDRLTTLQPPRRLRFSRLMFHPLNALIVPATRWRPGKPLIPRSVVLAIADHVRLAMGPTGAAIEAELEGRTTADTELIARLGHVLWPMAAKILAAGPPPDGWQQTGLTEAQFHGLARAVAALLSQVAALEALFSETADGLMAPRQETIHAIMRGVSAVSEPALPMIVSLLLLRLPEAATVLDQPYPGVKPPAMNAALDQAADLLIEQLEVDGPEFRIAAGTMLAAGAATRQMAVLLTHLETSNKKPTRKTQVLQIRARLDAACKARFTNTLEQDLLTPLRDRASMARPTPAPALEATARGLRVLETEARVVGSGRSYDALLAEAAETVRSTSVGEWMGLVEQARLVEILEGADAARAMLPKGALRPELLQ